ncbi:MAG: WXG100 family type VII secretion target [Oscillospiraceae bacterium]
MGVMDMSSGFDVDTDRLLSDIGKLDEALVRLRQASAQTSDAVTELDAVWEGTANDAFVAQYQKGHVELEQYFQELEHFCGSLKTAKQKYTKCERAVITIANNI